MKQNMELRFTVDNLSSVDADTNGELVVSGYVNQANQWSETLGVNKRFKEKIEAGAFTRAIEERAHDIHFLAEHDNEKILASTRNGSLTLKEDNVGLYMEARIAPTSWGRDYFTLIKEGILRNMSFGFKVKKDEWNRRRDGLYERTVSALELREVSVVRDPAYSQSTICARGIDVIEEVEIPDLDIQLTDEERSAVVDELIKAFREELVSVKEEFLTKETPQEEVKEQPQEEEPKEEVQEEKEVQEESQEQPHEQEPEVKEEVKPQDEPQETILDTAIDVQEEAKNIEATEPVATEEEPVVEENTDLSQFYKQLLQLSK